MKDKRFLILALIVLALLILSKFKFVYDVYDKQTGALIGEKTDEKQSDTGSVKYYAIVDGQARYNNIYSIDRNSVTLKKRITFKF